MTHEIREQKESEFEMLEDTIEGLKHLLKQKKKQRKRLRKELLYVIVDDDNRDIQEILMSIDVPKGL